LTTIEIPDRSNTFYIYGFPPETTTTDFIKYYKDFGKLRIKWIDEHAAFAVFDNPEDIAELTKKVTAPDAKYHAMTMAAYEAHRGNEQKTEEQIEEGEVIIQPKKTRKRGIETEESSKQGL
jgi:hypothetical protein